MKTIVQFIREYTESNYPHTISDNNPNSSWEDGYNAARPSYFEKGFKTGVEFAQKYTSVEDEFPDANIKDDEGIFYSEYLLIKVKGFEHPFVGYYVKANDDEFFDFTQRDLEEWIKQEDIISWRYIDLK